MNGGSGIVRGSQHGRDCMTEHTRGGVHEPSNCSCGQPSALITDDGRRLCARCVLIRLGVNVKAEREE